jgi:hypothetical protein
LKQSLFFQADPYEFEVESNADPASGDERASKKGWRLQVSSKKASLFHYKTTNLILNIVNKLS